MAMMSSKIWLAIWLAILQCDQQVLADMGDFDDLDDSLGDGAGLDGGASTGGSSTKNCPLLNITNAVLATTDRNVGSFMLFTCIHGYKKSGGSDMRECKSDGKWAGKDIVCKIITCPSAPSVSNSTKVVTKASSSGTPVLGTTVTYKCSKYYLPSGNKTRECLKSGEWSKLNFRCNEIECPEPPAILNAIRTPTGRLSQKVKKVGGVVTYSCKKGYIPKGSGRITCQNNGTWTIATLTCDGNCESPAKLPGTTLMGKLNYHIGSTVTYFCKPPLAYPLGSNHSSVTCLKNRKWSKPNIKCVEYNFTLGNCFGHDIHPVLHLSAKQGVEECLKKCAQLPKCQTFLYLSKSGRKRCYLKYVECPDKKVKCHGHPDFNLYRKVIHEEEYTKRMHKKIAKCFSHTYGDCYGRDIINFGDVKSTRRCLAKCWQRDSCKSVLYVKRRSRCYLKHYKCKPNQISSKKKKGLHYFTKKNSVICRQLRKRTNL
ncbi:sushi, von Willebrand factor type A, EGF and pentraxin domain-containing protein 1-like [Lineus longissimus]|uniref:sushi, von Willebrand factor type A, EGF and pentraxin domain-containing protein 1-like n=1 Tax=Lineus longissimus TaxID=88925 RepID=UPI002B4C317A